MNYRSNVWTPFTTLVIKEFNRFIRIWVQTVLPPGIMMALYFAIFGKLIGERIGEMDGYAYIDFIVPGLILMAVITNSYANVVSSFYQAKFGRYIEEILVSPVPNWVILAGYVGGGVARGMVVGVLVTIVAMFFTDLQVHNYLVTLLVFFLTSVLFSLGGFINAVYAKNFDDIAIVPTFVLTPLTYLGGIFYSIQLLPDFWQTASLANPTLYMVNAFRYGLIGISDINIMWAFVIILFFITVLASFSMRLLNKGVGLRS
ncbi:ABC transporter permease [Solemya velum gill symbiont]|uniref:ABC transporter permease n=1 Tax=Solemya velum gill symbiont TaxID=2340 RepID=UPI000997C329|nr:ABC transporter permease [Solemya velum gill symbiont]OOY50938.1 ABC transporter permease [Solemya velum gill symbiont]OOY55144.1 ABC transporter permease [Solemya velum gill symbiont]OOY56035.1 ABC transporter permease [Solemya velum gill symbiont]OOY59501.1 ABC transporter permease [Solemya velum gill symbiont]OOY60703.1 ABC transporter permease [Solemya velum gill symbiont]